jgi:RNA polymerase sigma-70 factor (ECF subfamily)
MRMATAATDPRAKLVTSTTAGGSVEGAMGRMSDDLSQASDAALVVAIGRWREEALAEAYRRHAGAVFALANRVLGSRPVAEEVVQEVFLRLWDDAERFDPERGSLRSYLLAITHGRSVDLVRSDVSRRAREERDHRLQAEAGYDLEHEVADLVVGDQVKEVMATLPDGERRAIELAYFGGYTYREVATMLDEPEGTVKTRIRTGLRRLRSGLADVGVGGQP